MTRNYILGVQTQYDIFCFKWTISYHILYCIIWILLSICILTLWWIVISYYRKTYSKINKMKYILRTYYWHFFQQNPSLVSAFQYCYFFKWKYLNRANTYTINTRKCIYRAKSIELSSSLFLFELKYIQSFLNM